MTLLNNRYWESTHRPCDLEYATLSTLPYAPRQLAYAYATLSTLPYAPRQLAYAYATLSTLPYAPRQLAYAWDVLDQYYICREMYGERTQLCCYSTVAMVTVQSPMKL